MTDLPPVSGSDDFVAATTGSGPGFVKAASEARGGSKGNLDLDPGPDAVRSFEPAPPPPPDSKTPKPPRSSAATTEARIEELEDAIRDMLDFTVGWCRPNMTDAEKFAAIRAVGEKALG